ncbi:MAG: polysaccharide deacetylase family protein [Desulfomonilia bacterium]
MNRHRLLTYIPARVLVILLCLTGGWNPAHAADQKVFVLCYHTFLGNKHFGGDISMQELRSQMDYFQGKGFHFISYADLLKGSVTGTQNLLLIIDDGNQSAYPAYKEILKPRHIKPMFAIYPSIIGKKSYALTWEQLEELSKDGCDIAAHGYYHELVNQKFYDRDKKGFLKEIYGSKEILEKKLNIKVTAYVYPNGVRADITKKTLKEAGYSYAFTITWGPVLSPLSLNKDPYELSRYMIWRDHEKENWRMISGAILKASAANSTSDTPAAKAQTAIRKTSAQTGHAAP